MNSKTDDTPIEIIEQRRQAGKYRYACYTKKDVPIGLIKIELSRNDKNKLAWLTTVNLFVKEGIEKKDFPRLKDAKQWAFKTTEESLTSY